MQAIPPHDDSSELLTRFASASALGLQFRRMHDSDLPFLARLYASTRHEELAPVPWPDEAKQTFLAQQFAAQHSHYQAHYPNADWLVILRNGAPAGRLYVVWWPGELRIIDIALLPEHRGHGLGYALLSDLIDEASAAGKPVSIHVEKNNPALTLYRRLGFISVEDKGVYDLMRRGAPQVNTAS